MICINIKYIQCLITSQYVLSKQNETNPDILDLCLSKTYFIESPDTLFVTLSLLLKSVPFGIIIEAVVSFCLSLSGIGIFSTSSL